MLSVVVCTPNCIRYQLEHQVSCYGVLVISPHPLFAEVISRLLQEENIEVKATVKSIDHAILALRRQDFFALVIDKDDAELSIDELISHLGSHNRKQRVILLSLVSNQMVVYYHEHIESATPSHLIQTLQQ